jgi:hypothetical protein
MPQQPQHQPLSFDATTQQGTHQRTQGSTTSFPDATELQSNTTLKSSQRPVIVPPSSMTHANQRFAFPVPGSGAIQRFAPSTSAAPRRFTAGVASGSGPRAPSRAMNMESGGQRVPFVPGAHGFE